LPISAMSSAIPFIMPDDRRALVPGGWVFFTSTCGSGGKPYSWTRCWLARSDRHDPARLSLRLARPSACDLDAAPRDSDFSIRWCLIGDGGIMIVQPCGLQCLRGRVAAGDAR
jgi:hypothetical protein